MDRVLRGALAVAMVVGGAVVAVAVDRPAPAHALANGLAETPPLGWNDWNAYGCDVSERLVKQAADAMVTTGMAAAGYEYVNIDDCWMTSARDPGTGRLVPDPAKFPDGISGTAAYVHGRGLKLGIYADAGTATCAGYPGSLGHEDLDARTFADWGVDYLKYDNCNNTGVPAQTRYTAMRDALAKTGRPILLSLCNWGEENVWTWGARLGNSWRTTPDITASWASLLSIFHANVGLASYAGPGGWNDPDMLEVGNGMTADEDRAEFSLWAEMAAPLIAGTNLTRMSDTTRAILTNRSVIAVDQDRLGKQGTLVAAGGGLDVLAKPLSGGDVSVVLFNETDAPATIATTTDAVGKTGADTYTLTDLWTGDQSQTTGPIGALVPAHGVVMYLVSGGVAALGSVGALRGAGSGRCLDVPHLSHEAGTRVQIWDCNGGVNQRWTLTSDGRLLVYDDRTCLDAYDNETAPGTKVEIWPCNGGTNQQWHLNPDGTVTGVQSGLCLDVTGAATDGGTPVELWTCNGGSNQRWTRA